MRGMRLEHSPKGDEDDGSGTQANTRIALGLPETRQTTQEPRPNRIWPENTDWTYRLHRSNSLSCSMISPQQPSSPMQASVELVTPGPATHSRAVLTGANMGSYEDSYEDTLAAASPRPWTRGLFGGDSERGMANSRLSFIAVNAHEALMAALRLALPFVKAYRCTQPHPKGADDCAFCAAIDKCEAALRLGRDAQ